MTEEYTIETKIIKALVCVIIVLALAASILFMLYKNERTRRERWTGRQFEYIEYALSAIEAYIVRELEEDFPQQFLVRLGDDYALLAKAHHELSRYYNDNNMSDMGFERMYTLFLQIAPGPYFQDPQALTDEDVKLLETLRAYNAEALARVEMATSPLTVEQMCDVLWEYNWALEEYAQSIGLL